VTFDHPYNTLQICFSLFYLWNNVVTLHLNTVSDEPVMHTYLRGRDTRILQLPKQHTLRATNAQLLIHSELYCIAHFWPHDYLPFKPLGKQINAAPSRYDYLLFYDSHAINKVVDQLHV
jgi:hypothetical protein